MSRKDAYCATPYLLSGELQSRPEVDVALATLPANRPYAAVPSWRKDGTWELWTVKGGDGICPLIISGPATTYPTEAEALAAGREWMEQQRTD